MSKQTQPEQSEQWEPDIFELNDWALTNQPELHRATWFLSSETARRKVLLTAWLAAQNQP